MQENKRIDEIIDIVMKLARGDYSEKIKLAGENDKLDSLARGINMMIDDMKNERQKLEQKSKNPEKADCELSDASIQLIQSEKISALGKLIAGIVHELKQPLNGIKIICQSILRDIDKNRFDCMELPPDLNDIIKQVDKMSSMINQIRDFIRCSAGNNKMKEE